MDMKHEVLTGNELFVLDGSPLSNTVKDFWAWAMSRLIADGPRGDLAEYIINTALGVDTSTPKHGWGEYDILYQYYEMPVRIEVKCSTVLQAWERETPSIPIFSITKTIGNDIIEKDTGYYFSRVDRDTVPKRRSDLYVFCLFNELDRQKADPLILDQWQFYIVPTKRIDEQLGDQKKISQNGLNKLGAKPIGYAGIKQAVDAIASFL